MFVEVDAVGAKGVPVKVGLADRTTLVVPVDAVTPVPPLATGSVPVTPVVIGKPVQLVKTPAEGVPIFGVVNAGLVDKTLLPEPVDAVTPVPPLATGKVPVTPVVIGNPVQLVKTPAEGVPMFGVVNAGLVERTLLPEPVELVTPVPPLATANVPVTPVVIGNPVQLVKTPADGVPMFGVVNVAVVNVAVVNVGLVDNTMLPVPVTELLSVMPP